MKYVLTESAVRKLRGVLAPRSGNTGAGGAATPVSPDDFPPPFTVRWAQSENNGSGAWVIWMVSGTPSVSSQSLVYLDTDALAPDNLIAASTLPAGWYRMYNVGSDRRSVYLCIVVPHGTGSAQCSLVGNYPSPVSDADNYRIPVATMSVDSNTGARRVKQYLKSVVGISRQNGGDVNLDDVSTDYNGSTEVQIKDWDTGTPAASTTIAQDINNPPSNPSTLVERDHNGALKYKGLGTLAQLLGSTVTFSNKTILTGWNWNTTTHEIEISTATVSAANGVITSWVDQPVQTIATTPISSIIN